MTDTEKQAALELERKQIEDARRVKEFLADPAVAESIRAIEKQYLNEFHRANTDESRRDAWAKSHNLTDFVQTLEAVLDSGKLASEIRSNRLAAEDRAAERTSRK